MFRRKSLSYVLLSLGCDFLCVVGSLYLADFLRINLGLGKQYLWVVHVPAPVYGFVSLAWIVVFFAISIYDPEQHVKFITELSHVLLGSLFVSLIMAGGLFFSYRDVSRLLVLYYVVLSTLSLLSWRLVYQLTYRLNPFWREPLYQRVIIISTSELVESLSTTFQQHHRANVEVVRFFEWGDSDPPHVLTKIISLVKFERITDVVVALPMQNHEMVADLVLALQPLPVHVHVIPDYFNLALYRITIDDFEGVPLIHLRDSAFTPYQRLKKRLMDIVVGIPTLLAMLPFMVIIAIAIKLDSRGSILFRQERVGENGQLFTMLKFRTMAFDANDKQHEIIQFMDNGQVNHKVLDDPRITNVGRWLRRTSLDEMPQLFNVLKGEMSLVGPRPEMPWLVEKYEGWQRKRFSVPQGMTGWWQVNSRSSQPMYQHTLEDIYYIQNYSLWLDIQIIWRTIGAVIRGRGAY